MHRILASMSHHQAGNDLQRIHAIDFIKGLCMILVIFDHVQMADPASHKFYQMLDQIEVAAFFFISGYLYHETEDLRAWFSKRFKRLIVPFLFLGLLYASVDIMLSPVAFVSGWKSYLLHIYLAPLNYPMWFICALFWILLLQRLMSRFPIWVQSCIVVFIIGGLTAISYGNVQPDSQNIVFTLVGRTYIFSGIVSFPFFWVGHVLRSVGVLEREIPHKVKWGLLALFLCCWYFFARPDVHLHVPSAASWLCLYVSALSGSMTILLISQNIPKIPGINYLGRHSLIVLGTHAIIINVANHLGFQSPIVIALFIFILMPFVIHVLCCYLPWAVGEKKTTV